ncbi:antitoxin VbhA family protein [Pasteurellaceae bacterium 22721_9_1]
MISEAEKRIRREAIEYAKATLELDGVVLSKELWKIAENYADGILDKEEFDKEFIDAINKGL